MIGGSAQLIESLRREGLIDEYRLMICPIVVGTGRRLFANAQSTLKLTGSTTTQSGVAILTYRPA